MSYLLSKFDLLETSPDWSPVTGSGTWPLISKSLSLNNKNFTFTTSEARFIKASRLNGTIPAYLNLEQIYSGTIDFNHAFKESLMESNFVIIFPVTADKIRGILLPSASLIDKKAHI